LLARYATIKGNTGQQDILVVNAVRFPHNLQDTWPSVIALLHEFNGTFFGFLE
jgi:hypothetical protein